MLCDMDFLKTDFVRTYFKAASFSGISKVFAAFLSLGTLWLINAIAGKDGFGLVMLGYSICLILSHSLGSYFANIVLYHTSRDHDHRIIAQALVWAALISGALGWALYFAAEPLAGLMNKPDFAPVMQEFSWMVFTFVMLSVLCEWCRARQKIITMVAFFEIIPVTLRVGMLGLAYIAGVSAPQDIGQIYVYSYLIPFVILMVTTRPGFMFGLEMFSKWNREYGFHSIIAQFLNRSVLNLMTFVLGFFASAGAVAEFALSARLAAFLNLPQLAFEQIIWPRLGAFLEAREFDKLKSEFRSARRWAYGLCFIAVLSFIVLLPYVLPFFGDYRLAYGLTLTIAVGALIFTAFGAVDGLLVMAGHIKANMAINAIGLAVMLASFFALEYVFHLGVIGAAIALAIGTSIRGLLSHILVRRLVKLA